MTAALSVPDQQVVQRVAIDFSGQLVDQHGEPASPAGAVTVDITKDDGTAVITGGATSGSSTNPRTYTLAAASNQELQLFTAVWKDGGTERLRTHVEVVGGFYFDIATAEAFDSAIDTSNAAKFRRVRRDTERECERLTGCSWVPRYRRIRVSGTGNSELLLPEELWSPRTIRSVRVYSDETNYTSFTSAELTAIHLETYGLLVRTDGESWARGTDNLVLEVEHGYDRPQPDLLAAVLSRFRYRMKSDKVIDLGQFERFNLADGGTVDLASVELDLEQRDVLRVYSRYSKRGAL